MSSRTSRTTTASPCLEAATRAARHARSRESVTWPWMGQLLVRSNALEILPHHDGDVRDARGLGTDVHITGFEQRGDLLRLRQEGRGGRDHLRERLVVVRVVLGGHYAVSVRGEDRRDRRAHV